MSMHSDCRGDTDPRIFSHMPKQGHSGNFAPWLIAQELDDDEIERFYIENFKINRFVYEKALIKQRVD
jgi:hypothetical protein